MCSSEREWVIATPSRTHQATHTHTHSGGVTAWLSSRQWWVMVSRNGGGFLWGGGYSLQTSPFFENRLRATSQQVSASRARSVCGWFFFCFVCNTFTPKFKFSQRSYSNLNLFHVCVTCANRLLYERRTKNGLRCAVVKTPQGYARQTHLFIFSHSPIPDPMDISQPFTYMTWTIYASTSRGHTNGYLPAPTTNPIKMLTLRIHLSRIAQSENARTFAKLHRLLDTAHFYPYLYVGGFLLYLDINWENARFSLWV